MSSLCIITHVIGLQLTTEWLPLHAFMRYRTLLSELFSAVPGAFVVVEPFKKFLVINKSDPPRSKNR